MGYPPELGQDFPQENMPVIGKQFITSQRTELIISKNGLQLTVTNNGETMFTVELANHPRVLMDGSGQPLVSLKKKRMTAHGRWQVFRGESSNEMLFSVKKSSLFQFETKFDVFLASKTKEDGFDFCVKGSWNENKCYIYAGDGDSNTIIAEICKADNNVSSKPGDEFCPLVVNVNPGIDSAFIIALVVVRGGSW